MKKFCKYTERRYSCEAIQYNNWTEAHWIATDVFGSSEYCVSPELLVVKNVSPDRVAGMRDADDNLLINRGDYIIQNLFNFPTYEVIPRSEFRSKWELKTE